MHKTIYMGISAEKLKGDTSKENIDRIVDETLARYFIDTAQDEDEAYLDNYVVGGRWQGSFAVLKSAKTGYLTDNNLFPYKSMEGYNFMCNDDNVGPYTDGKNEYIPVSGACFKEIDEFAVSRMELYSNYKYLICLLNKDERFEPQVLDVTEDKIYFNGENGEERILVLKRGDSFEDYVKRIGVEFDRALGEPDAYIDFDGVWHDDHEYVRNSIKKMLSAFENGGLEEAFAANGKIFGEIPEGVNHDEYSKNMFVKNFIDFMKSFDGDDYMLVIDGHDANAGVDAEFNIDGGGSFTVNFGNVRDWETEE